MNERSRPSLIFHGITETRLYILRNHDQFRIEPLWKLEIKENFLNLIKGIYKNPTANFIIMKDWSFFL